MEYGKDNIESSFETLTENVESLQEKKENIENRESSLEQALAELEKDVALKNALRQNEKQLESEKEQLKSETSDAKDSLHAIQEQLEQLEQENDRSAATLEILRQIGESTEEGNAIIADRRAWLEECFRRVEELSRILGEDYQKIGKFIPASERTELIAEKTEQRETSQAKGVESKTQNETSNNGSSDPGGPSAPGDPNAPSSLNPSNSIFTAQQYQRQREENDRQLQQALDQVFGKQGKPRQEVQKLVDQVNSLTAARYGLGQQISVLDPVLDGYTDHGFEHVKQVAANVLNSLRAYEKFAKEQGIEPGSEAAMSTKCLLIAALYHDTGMDGGLKDTEAYQRQRAEHEKRQLEDARPDKRMKEFGEVIRSGHPLQSALHILQDAQALKKMGIDPNETAVLAFLHSKSNSGVKIGNNPGEWSRNCADFKERCDNENIKENLNAYARPVMNSDGKQAEDEKHRPVWEVTDQEAFARREFEVAVQRLDREAREKGFKLDCSFLGTFDSKGNFRITNEQAYTRLQYEASVLRVADAQRPAQQVTVTHSGKVIEREEPNWAEREKRFNGDIKKDSIDSELRAVKIQLTDLQTGEPTRKAKSNLFKGVAQNRLKNNASKRFYVGESNVDRGSIKFNSKTGKIEIEYRVKDASKAPHSTMEILKERMAESSMPTLKGKVEHVIVLEKGSNDSIGYYRNGIGKETGYSVRIKEEVEK